MNRWTALTVVMVALLSAITLPAMYDQYLASQLITKLQCMKGNKHAVNQ